MMSQWAMNQQVNEPRVIVELYWSDIISSFFKNFEFNSFHTKIKHN